MEEFGVIIGIAIIVIIIWRVVSRRQGFDTAKNTSELQFYGGMANFHKDNFTYSGMTINYKDIVLVKNHYSEGYLYVFIFATDNSVLQVVLELNNGGQVILERRGRSVWGIGNNGTVKILRNTMSGLLADRVAPHLSDLILNEIDESGFAQVGGMYIDKTGITISKLIGGDKKLNANNYGEAKFNFCGDVTIYDKMGNKFYTEGHSAINACAVPMLLEKLYKISATAARSQPAAPRSAAPQPATSQPAAPRPVVSSPVASQPATKPTVSAFCTECGSENKNQSKFCTNCGKSLM